MHNVRAALLMVLAMAAFAGEDALIKMLSASVPTGQVLAVIGFTGMVAFWLWFAVARGGLDLTQLRRPQVILRCLCEGVVAVTFVTALATGDLSVASAILQAQPLLMTLAAAVFLGEAVGWRRWTSIAVGFVGVLLIVKPGTDAFQISSVFAVIAVLALALRDILTRRMPPDIGSGLLSASAFGAIGIAGVILMIAGGQGAIVPAPMQAALLGLAVGFGILGYITMVIATRLAEISIIAPFRYARLLFALCLAVIIFGERPDGAMLLGAAMIAGAGIYSMWREARRRRFQSTVLH